MGDTVSPGQRIDRAALERIIQRAAELQARDHEIGEGLTEDEVMQLGAEVGISGTHLRRALVEERSRTLVPREGGLLAWLGGPASVTAERTLPQESSDAEEALHFWLSDRELLVVKRRYPDRTAWEARRGAMATIRRSLGAGGRPYRLSQAREIVSQVVPLESGRCHVRLLADCTNSRRERVGGAAGMALGGTGATLVALTLGVALPVAVLPVPLGLALGFGIVRSRRGDLEKMQVALEQVLDRLEHREIAVPSDAPSPRQHPLARLAEEFRRQLGE